MLLLLQTAVYYFCVQPLLKIEEQWLGFLVAKTIALALTLITGIVASCIDPSA